MAKVTGFTCSEVCAILEAGAKAGVTLLQWGDFRAEFGPRPTAQVERLIQVEVPTPVSSPASEKANLERAEVELKATEVEEMLLRDPERYEELLAKGELPLEMTENGTEDT
jgi:hypothetical protein